MFLPNSVLILPSYFRITNYCDFWNGHSFLCLFACSFCKFGFVIRSALL